MEKWTAKEAHPSGITPCTNGFFGDSFPNYPKVCVCVAPKQGAVEGKGDCACDGIVGYGSGANLKAFKENTGGKTACNNQVLFLAR